MGASGNMVLVGAVFEAFSRRDAAAMIAHCDPAIEFHAVTGDVLDRRGPYVGHDGMREYLRDAAALWSELRVEPREFHERGDTVVALGRVYAWGAGRVIDGPAGWVWRVRGGRLVYGRVFQDPAEALAAAGMPAHAP